MNMKIPKPRRRRSRSGRLPLGQRLIQAMTELIASEQGTTPTRVTEIDSVTGQRQVYLETGAQTSARRVAAQTQQPATDHEADNTAAVPEQAA